MFKKPKTLKEIQKRYSFLYLLSYFFGFFGFITIGDGAVGVGLVYLFIGMYILIFHVTKYDVMIDTNLQVLDKMYEDRGSNAYDVYQTVVTENKEQKKAKKLAKKQGGKQND
jgi:hypothetical protein